MVLLAFLAIAVPVITVALGIAGSFSHDPRPAAGISNSQYSAIAGDVLNAETTDLVDGAPPTPSMTLVWIDRNGVLHTAVYSLVGDQLLRDYDGIKTIAARNALSVGFSRSGKMLRITLTLRRADGPPETRRLEIYARMLQ